MKRYGFYSMAALMVAFRVVAGPAASVDDYNVAWDVPSTNHHGSVPLGNGDIALNAWMSTDGDLQFYIAKTDAWDDNARLVKVGKVRVHFEPNLMASALGDTAEDSFHQELKLRDGCLEITFGPKSAAAGSSGAPSHTTIQLWVDANNPVIQLSAVSRTPLTATASIELWRTNQQELAELQTSDVMMNRKAGNSGEIQTLLEPDVVLRNELSRIGWYHHNAKSVGPQMLAEIQGLTGFKQADPLLHRTFGAVLTAVNGERLDDLQLRSPSALAHRFSVYVLTQHPSTPDQWLRAMNQTIRRVEGKGFTARRAAHNQWWSAFWDRSWIRAAANTNVTSVVSSIVPGNKHSVRIGMDQGGGNKFAGEIGRISVYAKPLADTEVAALAKLDQNQTVPADSALVFTGANLAGRTVPDSADWNLAAGITIEAWIKPRKLGEGGARIVDKITAGDRDGFLFDTYPGNSLRFICGSTQLDAKDVTPPGEWTHVAAVADSAGVGCRLYVNGKAIRDNTSIQVLDEAAHTSQMYHLQRFITACAGRGAFPIKFNGSLFTVPRGSTERDPDYRRWGPGYWWQNTRLPYISLCASGDFDLQKPLFHMYADELLPLCKYRTKHYLGHGGAYYPECIMFWGAVFSETYGWTPFSQRSDKLQESGWHKWEWVGGLELCWMMLDYYSHTLDGDFLRQTALPFSREILTFFEQHYPTNAEGKLVMHPSQALETWWKCTNALPELAGCRAVTERLLALPKNLTPSADRALWQRLSSKLPEIPTREFAGRKALAPAEFFADKRNVENPELYAVYPFRLFAFNRPNVDWALAALDHREDRGHSGWRQDDIFMAYLGLTEDVRKAIVSRARSHDAGERFPAFWGPNYDWTPDQDHGGVLMKAFQSMLLQTDGKKMFLLPAWPKGWDVDFKLCAPQQTVIEGIYRNGKIQSLRVTPEFRRGDLEMPK